MSVVQLVSRTAPLALAQMLVLALLHGEVAELFSSKYYFHTILHAMAVTGPLSAPLSLLPLQANKVTSPLAISIAFSVYRVSVHVCVKGGGESELKHSKRVEGGVKRGGWTHALQLQALSFCRDNA